VLTGVTGRVNLLCGQRKSKFKSESIILRHLSRRSIAATPIILLVILRG
jgi:hypothetical protein